MPETHGEQPSQVSPQAQLSQLIAGFRVTQAIGVAAELGIADLLANGSV